MKKLILILLAFVPFLASAEDELNITVSGSGANKEIAIKMALRSALEQAYGTFISSNTKVINDKLVSDDIVSLSHGNIKSYRVLSEKQIVDGHWYVLLNAVVNINQLVSYVHGQGSTVEVDMNAFGAKVQMEELNRNAEKKIIENLIAEIDAVDLWDYLLEVEEPSVSGEKFVISGVVKVKYNSNTLAAVKLITDVFNSLDMANHEENKVKGSQYFQYHGTFTIQPTLRNKYNNELLKYRKIDNYDWNTIEPWCCGRSSASFLRGIRFVIDPLEITIDGSNICTVSESKSYIYYDKYDKEYILYISFAEAERVYFDKKSRIDDVLYPHNIGDIIFTIHFQKELSREEAMKIRKIVVRGKKA